MDLTARDRLDRALVDLATQNRRPRCSDPDLHHLWTSEDRKERARAAELCRGCPLLHPCAEAAEEADERWHVWSGIDRTRHPKSPTKEKENDHGTK